MFRKPKNAPVTTGRRIERAAQWIVLRLPLGPRSRHFPVFDFDLAADLFEGLAGFSIVLTAVDEAVAGVALGPRRSGSGRRMAMVRAWLRLLAITVIW